MKFSENLSMVMVNNFDDLQFMHGSFLWQKVTKLFKWSFFRSTITQYDQVPMIEWMTLLFFIFCIGLFWWPKVTFLNGHFSPQRSTGPFWWPKATKLFKWSFWPLRSILRILCLFQIIPQFWSWTSLLLSIFVWALLLGQRSQSFLC